MTHDEIAQLDAAGLRLEVARVKGWIWVFNPKTYQRDVNLGPLKQHDIDGGWVVRDVEQPFTEAYSDDNIPDWPTDIAAAWELVEEVHAADCGIEIHDVRHQVGNKVWWDYEGTLYCPVGFGAEEYTITGNTPEELISRAYLMFDEWRKIS